MASSRRRLVMSRKIIIKAVDTSVAQEGGCIKPTNNVISLNRFYSIIPFKNQSQSFMDAKNENQHKSL